MQLPFCTITTLRLKSAGPAEKQQRNVVPPLLSPLVLRATGTYFSPLTTLSTPAVQSTMQRTLVSQTIQCAAWPVEPVCSLPRSTALLCTQCCLQLVVSNQFDQPRFAIIISARRNRCFVLIVRTFRFMLYILTYTLYSTYLYTLFYTCAQAYAILHAH